MVKLSNSHERKEICHLGWWRSLINKGFWVAAHLSTFDVSVFIERPPVRRTEQLLEWSRSTLFRVMGVTHRPRSWDSSSLTAFATCLFLNWMKFSKKQHNVVKHVILNHGKSKTRCAWNMDNMWFHRVSPDHTNIPNLRVGLYDYVWLCMIMYD